jgi:hypothetical protein
MPRSTPTRPPAALLDRLCRQGREACVSLPPSHRAQRAEYIAGFIAGRKQAAEAKAKRQAERKAPHTLKVGDILVSSWGYDQTNIDYLPGDPRAGREHRGDPRDRCELQRRGGFMTA